MTEHKLIVPLKTDVGTDALAIAVDNVQLLDKKQQDYGPRNISEFALIGVLVRMNDKFARIRNAMIVSTNGITLNDAMVNESLDDTFKDISNYCTIALMLRRGLWPKG